MTQDWQSPTEFAEEIGVAVDKILGWIAAGELSACNIAQRAGKKPRWRISAAQKAAFLAARCNQPTVTAAPKPTRRRRDEAVTRYF